MIVIQQRQVVTIDQLKLARSKAADFYLITKNIFGFRCQENKRDPSVIAENPVISGFLPFLFRKRNARALTCGRSMT